MKSLKRDPYFDIVRGFAIILVVMGHVIQCGMGEPYFINERYYENSLFKIIYSFHMPLFMLVSGYFFAIAISQKSSVDIVKRRIKSLLIPVLVWTLIPFVVFLLEDAPRAEIFSLQLVRWYINLAKGNLWFLWAVFYNSLIVLLINRFLKDSVLVYLWVLILVLFIPDAIIMATYKYMYLYFVVAYLFKKNAWSEYLGVISAKNRIFLIVTVVLSFGILFKFYNYASYIYTSGVYILRDNPWMQIKINIQRWLIGMAGSILVLVLLKYMSEKKWLAKGEKLLAYIGRHSMGVYIVNVYFSNYILIRLTKNIHFSYAMVLLETVFSIVICLAIAVLLSKAKWSNKLLLGGRN